MFTVADDEKSDHVALINRAFEQAHFKGESAVGQRITTDGGKTLRTIIGVVGNVRTMDVSHDEPPKFYLSGRERPARSFTMFIKSTGNLDELGKAVKAAIHGADPRQAIERIQTLEQRRAEWLSAPRLISSLISALGLLALLVTVSGVIGVVSYNVSQRVREVGIHMAIGATPLKIVEMFVAQGLVLFGVGVAIGIVVMFSTATKLNAILYKTSGASIGVYVGVALALSALVLVALYIPSSRASRFAPAAALRNE
jgi:ABC-type antimicrobial peptide transport system permease subunit